jgi:hypothetical protein
VCNSDSSRSREGHAFTGCLKTRVRKTRVETGLAPSQTRQRILAPLLGRARLHSLRKNSDFDLVLKGRGFSRAVSVAKINRGFSRCGLDSVQSDFFRSLFSRAVKSLKMCQRFSAGGVLPAHTLIRIVLAPRASVVSHKFAV